jgi:hypothetical protein
MLASHVPHENLPHIGIPMIGASEMTIPKIIAEHSKNHQHFHSNNHQNGPLKMD